MKERRRFYRINDSVVLNYRAFPEEQVDEAISRLKMLSSQHKLLHNSLGGLELRLDFLLQEITEPLPEIAEALKLINRKLSILSHLDSPDTNSVLELDKNNIEATPVPTHEVNLSGGGLAFYSPGAIPIGETMEIELALFPDYYNVRGVGRVVDCREVEEADPDKKYEVAVDFIYLQEEDREYIIAHILKKQSEELKEQRELREYAEGSLGVGT